jgi:hypothetical protein
MPIFEDKKTIFIHIPKTGGTSVTKKFLPEYSDFKHYDFLFYQNLLKDKIDEYEFFTVVRNPFERIVSYFNMHIVQTPFIMEKILEYSPNNIKEAFEIYVNLTIKDKILTMFKRPFLVYRSQSSFLINENNILNKNIRIIKYENLNKEIPGLPKENVKKHNISSEMLYSEETKNFIKNYFIDDFLNFGYDMHSD